MEPLVVFVVVLLAVMSPTLFATALKFALKIPLGIFTVVDRLFIRFAVAWCWELVRLVVPATIWVVRLVFSGLIRSLSSVFSVSGFVFGKVGSVGHSAASSGWGQLLVVGILLIFLCNLHKLAV